MSESMVHHLRVPKSQIGLRRFSGSAGRLLQKAEGLREVLGNILLLTFGSLVYIVGVKGVLMPHHFLNGGMVGISLIIKYMYPAVSLGLLYFLLNLPLFLLGWFKVSHKFILYTGFGIACFSFMTELVSVPPFAVNEPILAAILGGIVCGLGGGVILRSSGSVGGLDILSVYLYRKFSLPMGWTGFMVNSVILTAAAFFFSLEMALYTLIFIFTQSKLVDAVVTGFNKRKAMMIVSDKPDEIAEAIMKNLHRGVTFLDGAGAYTGKEKKVVFSVITLTELSRLKALVFNEDPNAFVVVNDTLDVLGTGHSSLKTC